jgi:hypothetical protein
VVKYQPENLGLHDANRNPSATPLEAQTKDFGPEYINIQERWTLRINSDTVLRRNPNGRLIVIIGEESLPLLLPRRRQRTPTVPSTTPTID